MKKLLKLKSNQKTSIPKPKKEKIKKEKIKKEKIKKIKTPKIKTPKIKAPKIKTPKIKAQKAKIQNKAKLRRLKTIGGKITVLSSGFVLVIIGTLIVYTMSSNVNRARKSELKTASQHINLIDGMASDIMADNLFVASRICDSPDIKNLYENSQINSETDLKNYLKSAESLDLKQNISLLKLFQTQKVSIINTQGDIIYTSDVGISFDTQSKLVEDALTVSSGTSIELLSNNNMVCMAGSPIITNSKIIGAIIVYSTINDKDGIAKIKTNTGSDFNIYTGDTVTVSTFDTQHKMGINSKIPDAISKSVLENGKEYNETVNFYGKNYATFAKPILNSNGQTIGVMYTGTDVSETEKIEYITGIISATIGLILFIIFVVLLNVIIKKLLTKPLKEIVEAALHIQSGNLDINIKKKDNDEIGILVDTFNSMSFNLKAIIEDVNYILSEMGKKNFVVNSKCEEKYAGEFAQIISSVNEIKSKLTQTLIEIDDSASQFNSSSEQISGGAQLLSQGTTEQAAAIEQLTETIENIGNMVQNTAKSAKEVGNVFTDTMENIDGGKNQMAEMITSMDEISIKSKEIEKIIKTIDDISFQTNILALNAAVEAARAGVAGRGFSVVADEVRNLAQKSADAANSTTSLIKGTIDAVEKGSKIASSTSETFDGIVQKTNKINDNIKSIVKANIEQAESIGQVSTGINQISGVVQTNSATAEQSAASCEELASQAAMLKNLVATFKLK